MLVRRAVIAAMALAALACGPPLGELPPGFVAGPVEGVPSSCLDGTYLAVTSGSCPSPRCPGPDSFAVCVRGFYGGCVCQLGSGELPPPVGTPDGGRDASLEDRASPRVDALPGSPVDGALFDVGNLGNCSGLVAKAIPAGECGNCSGKHAYALCEGLFYSSCSCDLPAGYRVVDGGAADGGSKDATTWDSPPRDVAVEHSVTSEAGG